VIFTTISIITSVELTKIAVVIFTTAIVTLLLFTDTPVLAILLKIHSISCKCCYIYNIIANLVLYYLLNSHFKHTQLSLLPYSIAPAYTNRMHALIAFNIIPRNQKRPVTARKTGLCRVWSYFWLFLCLAFE